MKQNGFTLVELMVGLVIAMLCMIMMLMLFKQISQISMSSTQDSEYDAQLKTGMLVMEKFVQNAGYGSGHPSDIQLGTHFSNPAIFWRFIPNLDSTPIAYQCQGIAEQMTTDGKSTLHRLVLISKANCGNSSAVEDGEWTEQHAILAIKNSDAAPIFNYQIAQGDCRPYGIDKKNVGVKHIQLSAPRQHMTGLGDRIQTTVCLNNIKATV
jgi:prepilin-type N-terminal cleavage/methylation domain-containing protein